MSPSARPSTENLGGFGSGGVHRPISCPPKPGYTQLARAGTPGGGYSSAISPGPGMHFSDFPLSPGGGGGRMDDAVSQQSFRYLPIESDSLKLQFVIGGGNILAYDTFGKVPATAVDLLLVF